jgi:hypothetical protein
MIHLWLNFDNNINNIIMKFNRDDFYKYFDDKVKFFIDDDIKNNIGIVITDFFYNLNSVDIKFLQYLLCDIIDLIAYKYNFTDKRYYLNQFIKNNGMDIKSLCLQIIPFVKKYDFYNLKDILISVKVTDTLVKTDLNIAINYYFKHSNFLLGLINDVNDIEKMNIDYIIFQHYIKLYECICMTNYKLYVNWLNIYPIVDYNENTFDNNYKLYINNKLVNQYISGKDKISFYDICQNDINNFEDEFTSILSRLFGDDEGATLEIKNIYTRYNKHTKGLYIGDYYDVLYNGYYKSVKNVKWLLYNQKDIGYYYNYLLKIFNLEDYGIFNVQFKSYISNIESNNKIYLDYQYEIDMFKNILIFAVNNSNEKFLIKLDSRIKKIIYNSDPENETDDLDLNQMNIDKLSKNDLVYIMSNIDTNIVYNYIVESIDIFKGTIYYKYIDSYNLKINDVKYNINLKNIYNIVKILSHDEDFNLLPNKYNSLNFDQFNLFFEKFIVNNNFINFKNNIKIQEKTTNNNIVDNILRTIKKEWEKIKVLLVLEYLQYNGLLSRFIINYELTDNINLPQNLAKRRKHIQSKLEKIFSNNNYKNGYYYLTNETYGELNKYEREMNRKDDYFKSLVKKLVHYTFYAMDWVSQLNVFNKYINHQIIYITGGTGTGKSTQVPKLLLYMMKMYDYNNEGNVICTQPRISPTEGNAKRVATELGVSINVNKYKTDNFYLQYSHQKDKHIKKYTNHPSLTFSTDGTLLETLINNPVLKQQVKTIEKKTNYKTNYIFTSKNIYDMVIVDEAHEHNTNMDMILTLMRYTCYINTSIRLVIISATMDDDEPRYRQYYKYINDNLLHPVKNMYITGNFTNNIYTDRRVDISIPGQNTQYKINENYIFIELTDNEKENAENTQQKSYDIIKSICEKSPSGHILFFSTGEREINQAVEYLNNILPETDIALPFYSKLHPNYQNMVLDLNKQLPKIRNLRENIYTEWGQNYIDVKDVPENMYKRAIIVATNVAEASITIDNLKFVVDIGYEKVMRFDKDTLTNTLNVEKISEASRLQRRGRVGRTSDGEVYYMYAYKSHFNIMPKYKISIEDFHDTFSKLAINNIIKNELITTQENIKIDDNMIILKQFTPYSFYNKDESKELLIEMFNKNIEIETYSKLYFYSSFLSDALRDQYMLIINNEYNLFDGYLFDNIYNNFSFNISGLNKNTLMDLNGIFYIVHPFENTFRRNILGKINNKKFNKKIWKSYITYMKINMKYLLINNNIGVRTIFYDKINEIKRTYSNITDDVAFPLFVGYCNGILLEVMEIISMIEAIGGSMYSIRKNKFGSSNNDLMYIYNITQHIRKYFNNMDIFNIYRLWENENKQSKNYKYKYDTIVKKYRQYKMTVKKVPDELCNDWDLLNHIKNNDLMDNDMGYSYWFSKSRILNKLFEKEYNYSEYCKNYNFDEDIIKKYFKILTYYIKNTITIEKDYDKRFNEKNIFEWLKLVKSSFSKNFITIDDKIIYTFFMSNPFNIGIKNNNYYNIIKSQSMKGYISKDSKCPHTNYVFFYKMRIKDNDITMNIVNDIKPQMVIKLYSHYFNNKLKHINISSNMNKFFNILDNNHKDTPFNNKEFPNILKYLSYL